MIRSKRQAQVESLESRQLLALTVSPLAATDVTIGSATIGAEISETGGPDPDLALYWGDDDAGKVAGDWDNVVRFKTSPVGQYTADLTGLNVDAKYYYRALAISLFGGGVVWTDAASFTTLPPARPTLASNPIEFVSGTSADLSGAVISDGGEVPDVSVYFGRVDGGEDVAAWENVIDLGPQAGPFRTRLATLVPGESYLLRVAASNSGGRAWTAATSFTTQTIPPLQISEFMAANGTIATSRTRGTPDGEFAKTEKAYDWIELQNSTAAPMNISGYYLTDSSPLPLKWQFPAGTVIPPHGFLVVYASGEDIRDPNLDERGRLHTNFQLSSGGEYIGLSDAQGALVSEIDTNRPQFRDVSYGTFGQAIGHMRGATPGAINEPLGASIDNVRHQWESTETGDQLVVTARVETSVDALSDVRLHYRVMFDGESTIALRDDGLGRDIAAGDGIYTAALAGDIAQPGEMIRYYVTAALTNGLVRREPLFVDPTASPEFFGTIVNDPSLDSKLPVLHRFIEDPRRAGTGRGTRVSVYYDGEFYDNAFIRLRGGTARSWPKKSYKLEFNDDHQFVLNPDAPRVDEVNLNATYTDKSYLRARLTSEFQLDAGQPSPETFHIRIQENGRFFSVALIVEQPDRDFLRRYGMDPDGSLYKAGPGSFYTSRSFGAFEKKTRDDEDRSDLREFLDGLQLRDEALERFLFDNVDLAAQINFMATNVITQNIDASDKNHFLYRDTNGTAEWRMLPWDLDLVFGPDALNTDYIAADENTRGATYPNSVHPLLGSRAFPLHSGKINMLLDGLITTPRTREMFLRRVRTLADEFLGTGYFEDRIDELVALLAKDVPVDRKEWGRSAHFGGSAPPMETVADRIKTEYLDRRLAYLTEFQVSGGVGIPTSQATDATLEIGREMSFDPVSNQLGDEYFTITNTNAFAVDVSGWQVGGSTSLILKDGTVIAAGDSLYLTRSASGFRTRLQTPGGGEGRFVQEYQTELPDTGGELRLLNRSGDLIGQVAFGVPTVAANASNLRITELNYNPQDGQPALGELLAGGVNFEFVEVTNIGADPIEMAGVRFEETLVSGDPQGIVFVFASQTLAAGESVVVVQNLAAFRSRYGATVTIADGQNAEGGLIGEFSNRLSNGGETLTLVDANGDLIQRLTYDDKGKWPAAADGAGKSLEWIGTTGDPNSPSAWRASERVGGSPGVTDGAIPNSLPGDFDRDGDVDGVDLELLCEAIRQGQNGEVFDLNDDDQLNQDDLTRMIQDILKTVIGDANVDGIFNSSDLVQTMQAGGYEDDVEGNATWATGDWNCDGEFDSSDLVKAMAGGGYTVAARNRGD